MRYRLGSSPAVYAPGVVRFGISGFWNEPDQPVLIDMIAKGWKIPPDAVKKLLSKEISYTVEGQTVVFEA